MKTHKRKVLESPWIYFLSTFIFSWGLCGILIFKNTGNGPALSFTILLLAMTGPGLTGILFTYLTKSREEIRDYWTRVLKIKRPALPWIAVVVGLPFTFQLLAGIIDALTGGTGLRWAKPSAASLSNLVSQLLTLCIIVLVPFFEELGWRGYAQDRLQQRHSAVAASLMLGCIWSLWHLPASFIPGTYQAGLGIGTVDFWLHFSGIIVLSTVISWTYINTQRSILVIVIFHAMLNLAGEIIILSEIGEVIYTLCWASAAIAVLFGFGREMQISSDTTNAFHV